MRKAPRSSHFILRIGSSENRMARDQEKWPPVFRPITRKIIIWMAASRGGHELFGPML
jgi:hypothetical protein